MAKKEFKAESKRLLELMINSIYTNKEIFLRELISNASDAIDKLHYKSLTEELQGVSRENFSIRLTIDKDKKTIVLSDNGIGMTKEELEENLGIIAKSGSYNFKNNTELGDEIDIIGQFGVGFYSAFMVSDTIKVISKAYGSDTAYVWESDGADGYTIEEGEKEGCGTDIILSIKDNTEEESYDEFLQEYHIKMLVKRYSDYIRYPIVMNVEKHRAVEATEEEKSAEDYTTQYESYFEDETINSMIPLWRKPKKDVTAEEYNAFYKEKFYDFVDPIKVIHNSIEGNLNYNSLLFIPSKAPYNYYSREYEKGLQLYSSGVLIMERCADLLPDFLSFVKGLVDSQDLSLNISRELLQQDRQLKLIATRLEKKILSELSAMLENDREKYLEFYKNFGLQLKYGMYADYGANKEKLMNHVLFHSYKEDKLITFREYLDNMADGQGYIYYACGESTDKLARSPQIEMIKEKGYDILFMTDDIDEFVIKSLEKYADTEFKSASGSDLGIEQTEEEKQKIEKSLEDNKGLLEKIQEVLGDKVVEVKLSTRLKDNAVCFATKEGVSIEMEKVLNAMPNANDKVKAEKILELNPEHEVFKALQGYYNQDSENENVAKYAKLLYSQALLIDGLSLEDTNEFTDLVLSLMK